MLAAPPAGDLVRLREAALASDYALSQAAWLTMGIGPRLSGSRGAAAAVDHVAGELGRQGLAVRREPVRVPRWVRGEERAELAENAAVMAVYAYGLASCTGGLPRPPADRSK